MRMSPRLVRFTVRLLSAGLVLAVCSGDTPTWAQAKAAPAQESSTGVRLRAIGGDAPGGRTAAIVVEEGALVHSALLYPVDAQGRLQGGSDAYAQATHVLSSLGTALQAAGTGLDRIARLHVYVADASVTPAVDRLLAERFAGGATPAVTIVESRMPRDGVLVAMDAVAVTARKETTGTPTRLVVDVLPPTAGRSAHVAVQPEGPFVIVSGRAAPGEFEAAVRATMEQLRGDLQTVGLAFEHAVQVKAFLGDMTRADQLQRLVAGVFQGTAPPLVVTEWRNASLPVEIELVATAPGATGAGERLTLVEPISARYSRIARIFAGRPIFVSGLTGASADPVAQVREVFGELRRLLAAAGSDMRHIAKATYYVSDKTADQEINTIRPTIYDPSRPPAASKISVQGTGRPGKGTVIDVIAVTTER
jgi:enamine deaminase RidA (YjgF/YER057c/UK114 family)